MRAHNNEHLDSLPVLDVSALKHVAYVFDALIYFMRSGSSEAVDTDLRREGLPPLATWNDPVICHIQKNYYIILFCILFHRMRTKMKKVKRIYQLLLILNHWMIKRLVI